MFCPRCKREACDASNSTLLADWYQRGWDDMLRDAWASCAHQSGARADRSDARVAELESEITVLRAHAHADQRR